MKFGYTIAYVSDVSASLDFYEKAFGLHRRFLHESGTYGELETGGTTLAFASHAVAAAHHPDGYVAADSSRQPLGIEVAFVTPEVEPAHRSAVDAGAREVMPPQTMPWGQTISYVRCPDGTLVELCTPVVAQ